MRPKKCARLCLIFLFVMVFGGLASAIRLEAQGAKKVLPEDRDKAENYLYEYYIDESDGRYSLRSEHSVVVDVLSERGADNNEYHIFESFYRRVDDVEAEKNGRRIDSDNIIYRNLEHEDLFIADSKAYIIGFEDVEVGDQLNYSYEVEYDGAEYMPLVYVSNFNHLHQFELRIHHPDDMRVEFDFFMPQGEIPYTVQREDSDETVLTFGETEETQGLGYYPFGSFHAAILVQLLDAAGKLVNPVDLNRFSDWYWGLIDFDMALSAAEAKALQDAINSAGEARGKARAIYDWVRSNVRYIADESNINAIVPRPPSKVFERRWGDCKDKAFLCAALGKQFGVEIHPVLVSTSLRPVFKGVHTTLYNHVICVLEDGGARTYFDPTWRYGEFGSLPSGDIGAEGLILNRAKPERAIVEAEYDGVAIDVTIDANIDSLDHGRAQIVLADTYLASAEYARAELSGYDLENFLSNMLTGQFRKLSLDYFEYGGSTDTSITFTAHADLSKLIINSRTKTYLPKVPFESIDNDLLERENDALGVYFNNRQYTRLTINLTAPGLDASGDNMAIGDKNIRSWMTAALTPAGNDVVRAEYEIARRAKVYLNEERTGFLNFCREFLKGKKDMFVFEAKD